MERGDISEDDMKKVLDSQKRFGEIVLEKGMAEPSQIESALAEQQHVKDILRKRHGSFGEARHSG